MIKGIIRLCVFISMVVLYTGCNSLPVKSSHSPYLPQASQKLNKTNAVVILGDTTEYRWIEIINGSEKYDMQKVSEDVVVLPVNVGSSFAVTKLKEVTFNQYSYRYVEFTKPLRITIDKPGIYYYGTLRSAYSREKEKVVMGYVPDNDRKFIAVARKKYSSIFDQLSPVNF